MIRSIWAPIGGRSVARLGISMAQLAVREENGPFLLSGEHEAFGAFEGLSRAVPKAAFRRSICGAALVQQPLLAELPRLEVSGPEFGR